MLLPPNAFLLPISQLLRKGDWPRDFFGPPGHFGALLPNSDSAMDEWLELLLSRVFFTAYTVVEDREHAGFHVDLWIRGALNFSVSPFHGFEFAVVDPDPPPGVQADTAEGTWVRIPTTVRVGPQFEIVFHSVHLVLRLPRDLFQVRSGDADPRAADPYRVEVPVAGRAVIDATFDLEFVPQSPVSFGPVEIFESGFRLTVIDAVLDFSRARNLDATRNADLPDDFRGLFARKALIELPPWLAPLPQWETFAENLAIGTGGLHGTIGARQRMAIAVDPADRPTIYALAAGAVVWDAPKPAVDPGGGSQGRRFTLLPGQFAPVIGRAFSDVPTNSDEWYFIDTTRVQDEDLRRLDIGYGWVRASDVEGFGDFTAVPDVQVDVTDPFTDDFPSTSIGPVDLRLEQFVITFRDSVPLPGIKAGVRIPVGDREHLQVTLNVDADLRFSARIQEAPSGAPLPDRDRIDTFALAPDDLVVARLDAIDMGAQRLRRSDSPHLEDEWEFHFLVDLSLFFFWDGGEELADKKRSGVSLTGLGIRGTKKDYDERGLGGVLALPSAEQLQLTPGKDGGKLFDRPLRLGPLALFLDGIGIGVESSGAFFLSLSGKIALTTALKLEGVAGVRFRWNADDFIGVAFEKASLAVDTKALEGTLGVEFVDELALRTDPTEPGTQTLEPKRGFRGRGRLQLNFPPRLFIDLEAAFGDRPADHVYFVVNVGSRASGIPVGCIAFYGISGLIGYNFAPDKGPAQQWYEDWFRDKQPRFDATSVDKWRVQEDSWAVGLGTILGTSADKGRTINGQLILIYAKPGPLLLLAGHGNMFRSLAQLSHPERAMLKLLIAYDGAADTLSASADALYQRPLPRPGTPNDPEAGNKIEARGLVDIFWDLGRAKNWHVYLGERPKDKRIRGRVWKISQADVYLMVDPNRFEFGGSAGFELEKSWRKVKFEAAAWAELVFAYHYEPDQVFGALALGGSARVSWRGIGLGVTFEVRGEVAFLRPRWWSAEFRLKFKTPWFLPDLTVHWHWGEREDFLPPTPIPLQGAASTHDIAAEDIELRLHPDLDPDGDRVVDGTIDVTFDEVNAVDSAPVVPLDSKPLLRFGHPINERTGLAQNPSGRTYHEPFGEDGAFRYDLVRLALWKRPRGSTSAWQLVDERVVGDDRPPIEWSDYIGEQRIFGTTRVHGVLQFDSTFGERSPVGLRLWAKTPFYSHGSGDQEAEETLGDNPDAPCPPPPEKPEPTCEDYARFTSGDPLPSSHRLDRVWLHSPQGGRVTIAGSAAVGLYDLGSATGTARIVLPQRCNSVLIRLAAPAALRWSAGRGSDVVRTDASSGQAINAVDSEGFDWIELSVGGSPTVAAIAVPRPSRVGVVEVCYSTVADHDALVERLVAHDAVRAAFPDGVDLDAQTLLEPNKDYKLDVETEVLFSEDSEPAADSWQTARTFVQHAYFRTAGPPGFLPTSESLRDLLHYVDHTMPSPGAATHYRAYDVGVVFRDDVTVRGMYARSGQELELVISDGVEQITPRSDGPDDLLNVAWTELDGALTNSTRNLWDAIVERSPCADPAPPRGGDAMVGTPNRLLRPRRTYRLSVVLASMPSYRRDRLEEADLATMAQVEFGPPVGSTPTVWEITNGMLLVEGTPAVPPSGPLPTATPSGSAAVVGDTTWGNYRVNVDVAITHGKVGVIAGYRDPENFYALTLDGADRVELARMLDGAWSILATASLPQAAEPTTRRLELAFTGHWLEARVDGESRATAIDAAFAAGRAGVLRLAEARATFSRLRVTGNPLYETEFTTSRFAHFKDHIASFSGSLARRTSPASPSDVISDLNAVLSEFPVVHNPDPAGARDRQRVFDEVVELLQIPVGGVGEALEVSAIESPAGPLAFLIESPEPLRWGTRTSVTLFRQATDPTTVSVDPRTLAELPAGRRLHPRRVGGRNELAPIQPVEAVSQLNPQYLRVQIGHDAAGAFVELVARARVDLGGQSLRIGNAESLFRFPDDQVLEPGEVLQLRRVDALPPPPDPGVRVLSVEPSVHDVLVGGGVVRLDDRRGLPEVVLPCPPSHSWDAVDPRDVRLVYDADTRNAFLFVADGNAIRPLEAGHYRLDFRFERDIGSPANLLLLQGSAAAETASLELLLSGAMAASAPVGVRRFVRVVLRELRSMPGPGPATPTRDRVALAVRASQGDEILVERSLPEFRIEAGTEVALDIELFEGGVDRPFALTITVGCGGTHTELCVGPVDPKDLAASRRSTVSEHPWTAVIDLIIDSGRGKRARHIARTRGV